MPVAFENDGWHVNAVNRQVLLSIYFHLFFFFGGGGANVKKTSDSTVTFRTFEVSVNQ